MRKIARGGREPLSYRIETNQLSIVRHFSIFSRWTTIVSIVKALGSWTQYGFYRQIFRNSASKCSPIRQDCLCFFLALQKNLLCKNSATLHAEKFSFFRCVRGKQGWCLARPTIRKGGNLSSAGHIAFDSLMLKRTEQRTKYISFVLCT